MYNSNTTEAALALARHGFHVLPTHGIRNGHCACRKGGSCRPAGKHPVTKFWHHTSTTNPERIRSLWNTDPNLNVAIHCGPSRLVVVDIDFKNGAEDDYRELIAAVPELCETGTVRTGSNGLHHYFRLAEGATVKNSIGALGTGIDVRAGNGYVVAPPSTNLSGPYRWEIPPENIVSAPEALLRRLASLDEKPMRREQSERKSGVLALPIADGERHATFAWLAGTARHFGLGSADTLRLLESIRQNDCEDNCSFASDELAAIVRDLYETAPYMTLNGFIGDWLSSLSRNQMRVALAYYIDIAGGLSTPALKRIEEATGLSREAVNKARRQLASLGAIEVENGKYNSHSARVSLRRSVKSIPTY